MKRDQLQDHNDGMAVGTDRTELSDEEIEAVDERMVSHICPQCGANDWLAEERVSDFICVRCDDCCRYGVLI